MPAVSSCAAAVVMAVLLLSATSALAQYQPRYQPRPLNDPATGERYHIEAGVGLWFPSADIVVASESLGIVGTSIDFKQDLGLQDRKLPSFQLVLRPSRRNKLRFQYIPIKYDINSSLQRSIVFNGQLYSVGLPINATMDWKAYRFGYEYDLLATNSGFAGVILDVKYTDAFVQLQTPVTGPNEFVEAKAPIPAIGAIGRYYIVPNISVTAEMSGFSLGWLPNSLVKDNSGHYVDFDLYGTLNFTNNLGVQAGYRSLDVGYTLNSATPSQCPATSGGNAGCFSLKGAYLGVVARY